MLKDLTYKVIIIDDEEDLYEDYVEFIDEKLKKEGYILDHERFEELSDLEDNPLNDVDLFLVDLKFGKEDKGPAFIKKIRENYLTDILFYSSDSKSIQSKRTSGEYQGVFFAIRDENKKEILDLIARLIEKMIKRSNTPLSSRGIVLGCVAELDNLIKVKIASLLLGIEPEQRKQILEDFTEYYYNSYKSQSKKIGNFFGCDFHEGMRKWSFVKDNFSDYELTEFIKNAKITDSSKNFNVLLKTYKALNGKDKIYSAISDFSKILEERNIFAHVQEELNEENNYQFKRLNGDEYLILTEDKCRELRNAMISYYTQINAL